jgi:type I restriction enzyme S subunit
VIHLTVPLRRIVACLDGRRVPLNREQRSEIQGNVPYWGAGGVLDHVEKALFDEPLVLLGEDGAPFFTPGKDVAYYIDGPSWVNNHIHALRPISCDGRFLAYALNSVDYANYITGATRDKLTQDDLKQIDVPAPPIEEQRRIADFLDAETARIDLLVQKRTQMSALLASHNKAMIRAHMNRPRIDQALTDARVPWLRSMPDHWGAAPLRYVSRIQRGASPRPIDDPAYFDDEGGSHAWVRISDVTASDKYLTKTSQRLSSLGRSLSVSLQPGELFVSIAASVGKPIITQIPCCIHDGFVAIRRPKLEVEFLYYLLLLGDAFEGLGKLGTQLNLNSDTVGSIKVPIPPRTEQRTIVDQLSDGIDASRRLEASLERQKNLLVERRQALITAAVTGQIDVSTASGRGIED